jgi:hypothetical protein
MNTLSAPENSPVDVTHDDGTLTLDFASLLSYILRLAPMFSRYG